jgi:hypothetical protein
MFLFVNQQDYLQIVSFLDMWGASQKIFTVAHNIFCVCD